MNAVQTDPAARAGSAWWASPSAAGLAVVGTVVRAVARVVGTVVGAVTRVLRDAMGVTASVVAGGMARAVVLARMADMADRVVCALPGLRGRRYGNSSGCGEGQKDLGGSGCHVSSLDVVAFT